MYPKLIFIYLLLVASFTHLKPIYGQTETTDSIKDHNILLCPDLNGHFKLTDKNEITEINIHQTIANKIVIIKSTDSNNQTKTMLVDGKIITYDDKKFIARYCNKPGIMTVLLYDNSIDGKTIEVNHSLNQNTDMIIETSICNKNTIVCSVSVNTAFRQIN